jgi:hypothetical protein
MPAIQDRARILNEAFHLPFRMGRAPYYSMKRGIRANPVNTWQKIYFGTAASSAAFLLESFLPIQIF